MIYHDRFSQFLVHFPLLMGPQIRVAGVMNIPSVILEVGHIRLKPSKKSWIHGANGVLFQLCNSSYSIPTISMGWTWQWRVWNLVNRMWLLVKFIVLTHYVLLINDCTLLLIAKSHWGDSKRNSFMEECNGTTNQKQGFDIGNWLSMSAAVLSDISSLHNAWFTPNSSYG